MVVLTFLDLGSSGLVSVGTCWGTCSEATFLFDEALLEESHADGEEADTCLEACSAGAFSLSLAAVSSGEETISSTCWGSCYERPTGLGVLWGRGKVFRDDLVERDRELSGVDVSVGSGEAEEDSERRVLGL